MYTKLNQIIAIEKGIKARVERVITDIHHANQKPDLFNGFTKTYVKTKEDNESFPAETKVIQIKTSDVLKKVFVNLSELFDVVATKDVANCSAKADIVIDGKVIMAEVPATFLLFLEKQLNDMHTLVSKLPTLDPAQEWSFDENNKEYRSKPINTAKTKKVQKALVLYPHSEKHPAQTQLITEDEIVGYWDSRNISGAISASDRDALVVRVETLQKAVKFAREQANSVPASSIVAGEKILGWLFSQKE